MQIKYFKNIVQRKSMHLLVLIFTIVTSCSTPQEYLDQENYQKAIFSATNNVTRNKNVQENVAIIKTAYNRIIDREIAHQKAVLGDEEVKDWIRLRKKQYKLLEEIGTKNSKLKGELTEEFDRLCDNKEHLDFRITQHFYDHGEELWETYLDRPLKAVSRQAHYQYQNCEKNGGHGFYSGLSDSLYESYQKGIVYYTSNWPINEQTKFLKALPKGADFDPDCRIFTSLDGVRFQTNCSWNKDEISQKVKVGDRMETDTSGNVNYIPEYETVYATVIREEIEITAQVRAYKHFSDVTGECPLRDNDKLFELSDVYEKVQWNGDIRAFSNGPPSGSSASEFHIKNNLEKEVIDDAEDWLYDIGF